MELGKRIGVVDHVTNEKDEQESLTNASVTRGSQAGELRAVPEVQPVQAAARCVQ